MPLLLPTSTGLRGRAEWPPPAWERGEIEDLSFFELAMLAAAVHPNTPEAKALARDVDRMDRLPPVYADVARTTLEGLARAAWHQQQALRGLSPQERAMLASADPLRPVPADLEQVLGRIDDVQLLRALDALDAASAGVLDDLRRHQPPVRASQALASQLGVEAGPVQATDLPPATSEAVALLAAQASSLSALERSSLALQLQDVPAPALSALAALLQALVPFAVGPPDDAPDRLMALAAAADAARPALAAWSAAATAQRLREAAWPGPALPDPDAEVPQLRIGLGAAAQADASLLPAPPLADALRDLALQLGDAATARQADELAAPVERGLGAQETAAVARLLAASARHLQAGREASSAAVPQSLLDDPRLLDRWADGLGAGRLPDAASPAGQALTEAAPYLRAHLDAFEALDALLAAAEGIVPAFAPDAPQPGLARQAALQTPACQAQPGIPPPLVVRGYLRIEPCGTNTIWAAADNAILVIDAGGDDRYEGRYAGAPFQADTLSAQPVHSPLAVLLDLGGSDAYEAGTLPCAHGAACADHAPNPAVGASSVAVLVDWEGDGAQSSNSFRSGPRSQGYAGEGNPTGPLPNVGTASAAAWTLATANATARRSYGVLVERVGHDGGLQSSYVAGNQSQGSAVHANDDGVTQRQDGSTTRQAATGLLVRLIGSGSEAYGSFEAGDYSQGAAWSLANRPPPVGALLNVAGEGATSDDKYAAGSWSQGALAASTEVPASLTTAFAGNALFSDVAGPSSRSVDTYQAGPGSRGYVQRATSNSFAAFVDALAPNGPDAGSTALQPRRAEVAPGTDPGSSDDAYGSLGELELGWGFGGGRFIDLAGRDGYPETSKAEDRGIRNDAVWSPTLTLATGQVLAGDGLDLNHTEDADGDAFPAVLEDAWDDLLRRWDSSDRGPDRSPAATPPRFLLDLGAEEPAEPADRAYAFVLDVLGDDDYGPGFSAAVHIDLDGADTYLGNVAAALGAAASAPAPEEAPAQHLLSFLLDLQGDDTYDTRHSGAQGFGSGPASGILFDLGGEDRYRAPSHAQGVGLANGLGVLVDLHDPAGPPQSNRFWTGGRPAQGHGEGGGRGILAATGDHNSFATDERLVDEGDPAPAPASGMSVNLGGNEPPTLEPHDDLPATGAVAGAAYSLSADVADPELDGLNVTWTVGRGDGAHDVLWPPRIEAGAGTAQVAYAWTDVPTDGRAPGGGTRSLTYAVNVTVRDTGGLADSFERDVVVHNPPPILAGGLRGPTVVQAGQEVAYQIPVAYAPDLQDPVSVFDWGDGSRQAFGATAIDWAAARFGGSLTLPEAGGAFPAGEGVPSSLALASAIDSHPATAAAIGFNPTRKEAPIQALAWFTGERQVHEVRITAAVDDLIDTPVLLSVVGLRSSQAPLPIALVTLDSRDPTIFAMPVPELPDLRGLLLRQVLPVGHATSDLYRIRLHSVQALGPGGSHAWQSGGAIDVDASVLDAYGGRNGTVARVAVRGVAGEGAAAPLELVDIAGRGPVLHASIAVGQPYELTLRSGADALGDKACIDWGDGTDPATQCRDVPNVAQGQPAPTFVFAHTWDDASPSEGHAVSVIYTTPGSVGEPVTTLAVHAETAFDLRAPRASRLDPGAAAQPSNAPPALGVGDVPLLFLALDDGGRTWHEGLEALAVVDAGGDDRHAGTVAASRPVAQAVGAFGSLLAAPPRLVIDAQGDDDYLSDASMTQGYGAFSGVSLLVDALGDDRYVAAAHAQGAAFKHGVGALVDLDGEDAFNLVPASDPVVRAGYASSKDAWLQRPPALRAARASPQPASADLMQGAGVEGFGLLAALGGYDSFSAATRAQGYGAHHQTNTMQYALPKPDCIPTFPPTSTPQLACALGLENYRDPQSQTSYYTTTGSNGPGGDTNHLLCSISNPIIPSIVLVPCNAPGGLPSTAGLASFLADGARYGPGVGVLLHAGPAHYHADGFAQGAADAAGRGALLSLDGGALVSARTQAQAYSRGGTATLAALGPLALRLGGVGQAAFEEAGGNRPENGATGPLARALLAGAGLDCGGECGPAQEPAAVLDLGALPAPDVLVTPATQAPVLERRVVEIQVTVEALVPGLAEEVAAFAAVRAFSPDGACAGPLLVPPVLLLHDPDAPSSATLRLDLAALLGDVPLHPAGCTEVIAFARHPAFASVPASAWGVGSSSLVVLPPPSLRIPAGQPTEGTPLVRVAVGQPWALQVEALDPLARDGTGAQPNAAFRLTDAAGDEVAVGAGPWQDSGAGARREIAFTLPHEGTYTLCAQTRWNAAPAGDAACPALAVLEAVVADTAFSAALPDAWKQSKPLGVEGAVTAFDPADVAAVVLRAVADVGVLRLRPDLVDATCPGVTPGGHETCAALGPVDGLAVPWETLLAANEQVLEGGAWKAGEVRLEAAAIRQSGERTSWSPLGDVTLDGDAPTVHQILTKEGRSASNAPGGRVRLLASITDSSASGCPAADCPGSGLDEGALSMVIIVRGDPVAQVPLVRDPELDALQDGVLLRGFSWEPVPGLDNEYEVLLSVADRAGNLRLYNPGFLLGIDRQAPAPGGVVLSMPTFDTPHGPATQDALAPGDTVGIFVQAYDSWWLDGASARVKGTSVWHPLQMASEPRRDATARFEGAVTLPTAVPGGDALRLEVEVRDRAGNVALAESAPVPFHEALFDVVGGVQVHRRSAALDYAWRTDRATHANATLLDGDAVRYAEVQAGEAGAFTVGFAGLQPQAAYVLVLRLWDDAGWTQTLQVPSVTAASPVFGLELGAPAQRTLSGVVEVAGVLHQPPPNGVLRLRLADGTVLGTNALSFPEPQPQHPFAFKWDSTADARTLQGAHDIRFVVEFTDSAAFSSVAEVRSAETVRRVDNAPPVLAPWVEGPAARNGWHNGTLRVHAGASDDTLPLRFVDRADCGAAAAPSQVTLSEDGRHDVTFHACDAAAGPNRSGVELAFRIDHTLPLLEAAAGLAVPATANRTVPLKVQANDALSGIEAFRLRSSDWTAWSAAAPASATLAAGPDGERWVDVEVRDVAGNVRRQSFSLTLDRLAPEILTARWAGWSDDNGTRVPSLDLLARDLLNGTGRPAGVAAVRFASANGGAWGPWQASDGNGLHRVPAIAGDVLVQLLDHAGNTAVPARLPAPLEAGAALAPPVMASPAAAAGPAFDLPVVSPASGPAGTRFTFTVVVRVPGGVQPDRVWLEWDGERTPMVAAGPVGDGQRYTAELVLGESRFFDAASYRIVAEVGGTEVVTAYHPGPLVTVLGDEADAAGKGLPTLAPLALAALVLLAAGLRRRREKVP